MMILEAILMLYMLKFIKDENIGVYFDFSNLIGNPILTILNPISYELYNLEFF
ncbi:hypothetical protein SAMN04487885_10841 [Clostridium cadaveris]|uniref:Uncharacterized protein n=1 Tax=Clostridium cadaveris TaxID=1529 RepID=A0A1I2L1X0_9CLOT|nr:hypothetical protein SAMN04487885_10841 [Clostridium cadaveris]